MNELKEKLQQAQDVLDFYQAKEDSHNYEEQITKLKETVMLAKFAIKLFQ